STDTWFRPSDVTVAPDGSIFVCDWYDPGVGGHGMGDWTRGRVFRLTPKGHTGYKVPEVKLDTAEGVLAALGSPCLATRALAINRLRELPLRELTAALSAGYLQIDSPELRVRSWWCFAFGGTFDDTLLKSIPLIMQSDARLRAKNIRSIERALPKMVQGFG